MCRRESRSARRRFGGCSPWHVKVSRELIEIDLNHLWRSVMSAHPFSPMLLQLICGMLVACCLIAADSSRAEDANEERPRFIDHSLLVAPEYPCTWPAYP